MAASEPNLKVVIVGGVAGGASAATRLRRMCENCSIKIFEKGQYPSFANCGLPYRVGNVIPSDDKLIIATPALFTNRYNVTVYTEHEVLSINRSEHTVTVKNLQTGVVFEEPYDKLVLSPGASPIRPPLPGIDIPGIFTLRTIPNIQSIIGHLNSHHDRHAVVIGGGFIGLEMADQLVERGLRVTVLEKAPHIMPLLASDLANCLQLHLQSRNVTLITNDGVSGFEEVPREGENDEKSVVVLTELGKKIAADVVIFSIGVMPENSLAKKAGLEIGVRGSIKVNDQMQTNDKDIYAVGDAVETEDYITHNPTNVPLAGPANRMGRLVGDVISGHDEHFRGVQGTAVCNVFGMTIAMCGANEASLLRSGITKYAEVNIHPGHHAGYYPGAQEMHLKMYYGTEDGTIYGIQGIGKEGVERRIDVVSMAIQMKGTVFNLAQAELCYAPQFGAAKDPVNMLGFIAANSLQQNTPLSDWKVVPSLSSPPTEFFILDVRTVREYNAQHVPQAVNIPLDSLRGRLEEVPRDKIVHVMCQGGQRAYYAVRILRQNGMDARFLSGGMNTYCLREGIAVVKP